MLHLELVLPLLDDRITLRKSLLICCCKTCMYKMTETVTSIQQKMASTLESVQYKDFHLQPDFQCGTLIISIAPLLLHYSEV